MTEIQRQLTIKNAEYNFKFYLQHFFECWTTGDEIGRRNAFLGAKRCQHVLRIAGTITTNNDNEPENRRDSFRTGSGKRETICHLGRVDVSENPAAD